MAEMETQKAIENAIHDVIASHLPSVEADLVQRVLQKIQPLLQNTSSGTGSDAAGLAKSLTLIHAGASQKEILRALLDSTEPYAARSALFVVKAGAATGWLGRGFSDDSRIRDFHLEVSQGAAAQALQSRQIATGNASEMDSGFLSAFAAPSGEIIVLPLLLRDKVAALVYADGGQAGHLNQSALEVLVVATGAWLEVASLRKQSQRDMSADSSEHAEPVPAAAQAASSFPDPFASHAPRHAAPSKAEAAAASAETAPAAAAMSPEDADTHRKAQRFARLLMDEIKLYNQAKVSEGRKNRDLYDRLKEDIEKSRATYMKRYGSTVASQGDYFSLEMVRSLAEDDVSLMGANFRR